MLTQSDLLRMSRAELAAIVATAHPIDHAAVAGHQYLGIDLSLPAFVNKLLWKTFRKTFYADPEQNLVRGWNVKLEQHGIDGPRIPLRDSKGSEKSFGHYHLLKRTNERFPGGWAGPDFLHYGVAGNHWYDPGAPGYCPLVAVNEGSTDLLLGWEVFKLGPLMIPLPDYWLLVREGPIETIVPVPVPKR